MAFEPIPLFPNFIYLPRIVPLVYDDTLSYIEFLYKVLNKLNECIDTLNDIGVDVEELKTAVERLGSLIDGFDGRITDLETNVDTINTAIDGINTAITGINSSIDTLTAADTALGARITALENTINTSIAAAVAQLQSEIGAVSTDVETMQSQVTSNTGRIDALEAATFEAPTESNFNMFVGNFMNLAVLDYEIVKVTDNGSVNDNIQIVDNLIRFFPNSGYNEMALVIHNILPYYGGNPYNNHIFSFGNRYKTSGSSNGVDYCINVPFSSLTGTTPYIASTGYTATRASMQVVQLKRSTTDNNFYDLWIYNRWQGNYGVLTGSNVDFLNLVMVNRSIDATQSTDNIKKYFITCLNSTGKQIEKIIDKKSTGILNTAQSTAAFMDQTVLQDAKDYADSVGTDQWHVSSEDMVLTLDDLVYHEVSDMGGIVEIVPNAELPADCTVDFSACMVSWKHPNTSYTILENNYEEYDWFINIEVTLTGNTAVNTGGDYVYLGFFRNDKNAVPAKKVPLTIHHNVNTGIPVYVDAFYNTVGNVGFRLSFDDTNYDYTNRPVKLYISGYVPLRYITNITT